MAADWQDGACDREYEEAARYVFQNARLAPALGPLDYWQRFDRLLDALGRPERLPMSCATIHVAGTNGKGTTTALCAELLRGAGVGPVGLYTSPHIHTWRERIQIDGLLASREQIVVGVRALRAAELALAAAGPEPADDAGLAPFERLSALALLIFKSAGVRWLVLETGLGGRWDCTNHVIADRLARGGPSAQQAETGGPAPRPAWPVPIPAAGAPPAAVGLCRVGLDHTNVLGGSLAQIGAEKAGVLKRGVRAYSVPQDAEVDALFRRTAAERGATIDFPSPADPDLCRLLELAAAAGAGAAPAAGGTPPLTDEERAEALPSWLRPQHQQHNLALAIALVRDLLSSAHAAGAAGAAGGAPPPGDAPPAWAQPTIDAALRAALALRWPGRLEVVPLDRGGPLGASSAPAGRVLVLDCAHNADALRGLLGHLRVHGCGPLCARADPRPRAAEAAGAAPSGAKAREAPLGVRGSEGARLTIVFGANRDKDTASMLRHLGEFALSRELHGGMAVRAVQLVASMHPKASDAAFLLARARAEVAGAPWLVVQSVAAAVDMASGLAAADAPPRAPPEGGKTVRPVEVTLFVGSVSVIGEARARLAATHPSALPADDWAHEAAREVDLGVLAAAI